MQKLIYILLLISFNYAQLNWDDDGAPFRQGLHIEWQRTGDGSPDGSMIYAWSDCRNGVRDIIVQKIDVNGNNLWGANGVVAVKAAGRQEDPQLVTDGYGGAYVIWMDYRDESDAEGDIYAQYILPSGEIWWGESGIPLTYQTGQQFSPNICSDGQNGAYVIWKDNAASSYGDIYATHLTNEGAVASGVGVPIVTNNAYRSSPSLNTAGSGEAVLVWSDDRNSDEDLYAQRISVSGNTITTEWGSGGKLVCDASGEQTSPRVAQYDGDKTIITWEDARNGSYTDVYYQILDTDGEAILSADGVSACTGNWDIIKPRVKAENSVAYIVWEDRRNGWTSDIYTQKINSDGSTDWGNGLAISTSEESQTEPRLTMDGIGGVYFVWEDARNIDVIGNDIYAQHVNSSGVISHDENGKLICDAENLQFNPLVRNDGSGGAMIVWGDQRSGGSYGMYIQRLRSSGTTLTENGLESFFGISTDAANEPYNHGAVYLQNDNALLYWQDNRWGKSKIYGSIISSSFNGSGGDYFTNSSLNGQQLSELNLLQVDPNVILAGDKLFLSYKVEESPNENLYFQLLNLDLSPVGDATAISNSETSKQGFNMAYGEDGNIYYAYSENYDINVQKISSSGNNIWTASAVASSADDVVKAVYASPNSGCIIIYESQDFFEGTHIYAVAISGNGDVQSGWPILISDVDADQFYESSSMTEAGFFISFINNIGGSQGYDVYGQFILFSGAIMLGDEGQVIAGGSGHQQSSYCAYNSVQNRMLVCYEYYSGNETDIYCNDVNLNNNTVGNEITISNNNYNQKNPYLYWSGHSFIIVWEDGRMTAGSGAEKDIFYQEYKNGFLIHPSGGEYLTLFDMKQERPIISKYSDSDNLYMFVWEDYRSTGKEFCANLYGQSYTSISCPSLGDLNYDGGWNVLDIVALANCVLANNCIEQQNGCAGDMNGDGGYNVLDIVNLANCILETNCGGRVVDASHSRLIIEGNMVSIEADGFIGGVQMTLSHGVDFKIEMTDRALHADYLTNGNETRLLVINPETEDLFSYSSDFEITEIIVANTQYEVSVDLPIVSKISLSEAYPNPFNPTTIMTLTMPVSGEMQVEVYNLLGQVVATLTSGYMDAGSHKLTWDASDVSSGMYFVKAEADGFTATQKLMLVK